MEHLKKNHANLKNVLCNFKRECKRRFSSLDDLVQHLKNNHGPSRVNEVSDTRFSTLIDIPCKCDLGSGRNFSNVTELMKHLIHSITTNIENAFFWDARLYLELGQHLAITSVSNTSVQEVCNLKIGTL